MPQLSLNCNHLGKGLWFVHYDAMDKMKAAKGESASTSARRAAERRKRQAAALQANLRRRKADDGPAAPDADTSAEPES